MLAGESLRILFSRRENVIMAVVKFVLLAEKSWRVDLSRAKTKPGVTTSSYAISTMISLISVERRKSKKKYM